MGGGYGGGRWSRVWEGVGEERVVVGCVGVGWESEEWEWVGGGEGLVVVVVLTRSFTVWVSAQPPVRLHLILGAMSLWTRPPRPCSRSLGKHGLAVFFLCFFFQMEREQRPAGRAGL